MKRVLLVFVATLITARASAQPWGYDASWSSLPMTVDTQAVKVVLDRGLCEQSGVSALNAAGVKAALAMPGSPWPCTDCVQWYGKGTGCDGKYQYVSADGPYPKGWEIKWSAGSWVDTGTPPPGFGAHHPTQWTFFPFEGPTYVPPPIIASSPAVTPSAAIDLSLVLSKLEEIEKQNDTNTAKIEAAINEPGWFKAVFSNHYVQMALAAAASWLGTKAAQ